MSFKCQIFQTRLTFNNNVFVKNCDVRLIIILCIISAILPIIKCAKLENPQIRLLINDDDLLQEKTNIHEAGSSVAAAQHDNSGEHFNLYRSELKRLSYETIHRILRDENEPSYRREDTELRYYQKRSPSYEESHQLIKRSTKEKDIVLNLSERNLTEIVISPQIQKRLSLVSSLDLSHNYLNQFNISLLNNITSLTTLNLQNNSFTSIPLVQGTTLRTLNLNNNLIKTSTLNSNIYLRNLYLSGNLIENLNDIQLSLLKNLESLDISHNQLKNSETSFFTERMHNLKHLNLAYNQLGSIYRETFYNLLSLNTLLLSHNNISDIDYETFLALPNLQYLDLSFNVLRGKSIRALQGITGLVALNIAFNPEIGPFMQEFVASWSLKELDASGTGLCQIPAALAQSVRSLKLTHNWLKVISCGDLDSYPLLQYLDLSFSHIEHIEDDALGRLEILEILMLDHNKLRKIPYSLPVSLEHLFLQNNDIMEVPQQAFQGLNNLKTLDLSHNKLLYLPDIMLPKLQTLNLQSSEIRGISQGIIHSLPKLNDLMLEDNPIKCADLLGIAEWASTCRLRGEKDETDNEEEEEDEENFVIKIQDLKNKFERMHNFYEQFGFNNSYANNSLLTNLKAPACVKENLFSEQTIKNSDKLKEEEEEKEKVILSNATEEINFNQNSITSSPQLEKTLIPHKRKQIDLDKNISEEKENEKQQKLEDETAVKTIILVKPTQTLPTTMQSSILNEKQTSNTTTESFNSNPTTTTTFVKTTTTTATKSTSITLNLQDKSEHESPKKQDIVVKPRFTNETKTFDHLTANADVVATTTTTNQQTEVASKGNTSNESSSNMTEVVEAVTKRTKEAEQLLEDMQHKTISAKTFQTTKSKKWLKQKTPSSTLKGGGKEMPQNTETNAAAQFIKSTTFATPINSQTQVTTIANQTVATETALATTTMAAEAFKQHKQENQHINDDREGGAKELKEKDVHVKDFEGTETTTTRSKMQINLENENNKQQHEIKTKITTTTKEIKSLATEIPISMQTKLTDKKANATATTTATVTIKPTTMTHEGMTKITLKISPELTANKEINDSTQLSSSTPKNTITQSNNTKTTTETTTTTPNKPAAEKEKHVAEETTPNVNAALLKTFKTIEATTTTTTKTATLVKDKDLASNYNDNDNNNNRQITKTINETNSNSNILDIATTTTSSISSSSTSTTTNIINTSTRANNKNNQISKTSTTTITAATTAINHQQQQYNQTQFLEKLMPHYQHQSLEKDVNVKCMQSNSNECNSTQTTTTTQNEFGAQPTIEATLEQTTVSKTSTEIPTATEAEEITKITSTTTTAVTHKHEPLQLLVKDRHLIGTPLLMHKGENLMVTADELILPTNNHNAEQEENNSSNKEQQHDLETSHTMAGDSKNKHNLEISQTTRTPTSPVPPALPTTQTTISASTPNRQTIKTEYKINKSTNKKGQEEDIKLQDPDSRQDDMGKIKKPNYELKTKKPSLIMKKMTIITKQHEDIQHNQSAEPLENEVVHNKQFDNSHYQELKPLTGNLEKSDSVSHMLKHSTVNTPISSSSNYQDTRHSANLLKQPHTFQHEHELLIQQILQDQQAETHAKLTKTEQWSDLRKAESKENHPGLILLVSSGLFLVLLLGLMHVYRCDMPWRRHSPSHHLRPHQRQNHSLEDDSHSFLSYSEGMQKWHHSTRLEAPYNSPLHNLHVRELQKTSATEKPATVKSTASNFKPPPLNHSIMLNNSRSLSQSSTTTTSTASASSSAILDDESFYIEMTPDSGQFARALQSELLPMELLNMAQIQTLDYQDQSLGDSQTSMEDDCVVHYQQTQKERQLQSSHLTSLTTSDELRALPSSSSISAAATTTSLSVKPHTQTRKFGLW